MLNGYREIGKAIEEGRVHTQFIIKTNSPILPAANWWGDLSMAGGQPSFNAYLGDGLVSVAMYGVANKGIYLGQSTSPFEKRLYSSNLMTVSATFAPATLMLVDYLLYYPLIDMDDTSTQTLVNSSTLPRYTTGEGVRVMLVSTIGQISDAQVTVKYTNQAGVEDRTSTFYIKGPSNIGCINVFFANDINGASCFIPLQNGDTGVRSIQSITTNASAGGYCSLVLVKPVAETYIRERFTVTEQCYAMCKSSLPKIENGAYLNFLFTSGVAAISSQIIGELNIIYN